MFLYDYHMKLLTNDKKCLINYVINLRQPYKRYKIIEIK